LRRDLDVRATSTNQSLLETAVDGQNRPAIRARQFDQHVIRMPEAIKISYRFRAPRQQIEQHPIALARDSVEFSLNRIEDDEPRRTSDFSHRRIEIQPSIDQSDPTTGVDKDAAQRLTP